MRFGKAGVNHRCDIWVISHEDNNILFGEKRMGNVFRKRDASLNSELLIDHDSFAESRL